MFNLPFRNCKDFDFENGFASLSKCSKTGRAFDQNEGFITEDYPVGKLISYKIPYHWP